MATDAVPPRLSERLRSLLEPQSGLPTTGEFLDRLADDGFAVVLGTLALPALIPIFPPGTAVLIGIVFALVGARMLIGGTGLWVPAGWRRRPLPEGFAAAILARGVPIAERLERWQPPRVRSARWLVRASGCVPLLMGLIMVAPLPALNTLPALVVLVLAVGLLRDDALFIGGALVLSLLLVAVMGVAFRLLLDQVQQVGAWVRALLERLR